MVQVEYLRQSQDDRLTLILHPTAPAVPGLWVPMDSPTLAAAKTDLAAREQIPAGNIVRDIGAWSAGGADPATIPGLGAWAFARGVQHVVWTALGPKFQRVNGTAPTKDQALAHWSGLTGPARDRAEEYVRRTPRQVDTPYRREAVARLDWSAAQ